MGGGGEGVDEDGGLTTLMGEQEIKLTFRLTQCYIEMARSAFTTIHHRGAEDRDELVNTSAHNPMANVKLALVSMSIIYSYLAIESFTNYQFWQIWAKRNTSDAIGKWFQEKFPKTKKFEDFKRTRLRDLGVRIKVICDRLGYRQLHKINPTLWQKFKELVEDSRHFLIHPFPDPEVVQEKLGRIMFKKKAGEYVQVACDIIRHFYQENGQEPPLWLDHNLLFRFRGVDCLVGRNDDIEGPEGV